MTCAVCRLNTHVLVLDELEHFTSFGQFEAFLRTTGPWVAGLDFPFGQSRRFIENIGWPRSWQDYVQHVGTLDRAQFRKLLDDYRAPRAPGDKEHQRQGDRKTGAISPQKLYGVPVGLMFFAGSKRLLESGVTIPGLQHGDRRRFVVEAYPGVLARRVTRDGYKSDSAHKQSENQRRARKQIVDFLTSRRCADTYGITVDFQERLEDDPKGDVLDALLCAVQASWAWTHLSDIERRLDADHRLEGWIADPAALDL